MVFPLGPGKFYGSSLPRPRFYTDVKFNDERVDPPTSVLDPLLSWANEAHWSMGGLSFKRLRLQGRIEGNVHKLRVEQEKIAEKRIEALKRKSASTGSHRLGKSKNIPRLRMSNSSSPPPAPIATKRRRFLALLDDEDEEEQQKEETQVVKRRLVKKLGDDFDRVAAESERTRSKAKDRRSEIPTVGESVMKIVEEINETTLGGRRMNPDRKVKNGAGKESSSVSRTRTSPRLVKRVSN